MSIENYQLFIDGKRVNSTGDQVLDVINPANGEVWATIADGTVADIEKAVNNAHEKFIAGDWKEWRSADRAEFLITFGRAIYDAAEELADLQVQENGKLKREMLGQMRLMKEHFNYYASLAQMPNGNTNQVHLKGMFNFTRREPLGVVAAITPWNSPLQLLAWKLGPALAMGNTIVTKPSEVTSISTLRLAEIAVEAGLPAGVFNVVTGTGTVAGTSLVAHPKVKKVAFTGSTMAGKAIAKSAADSFKSTALELGGKSPNIVFADADLPTAINGLVGGIFAAGGQSCVAGSRILVQEEVYDEVVTAIAQRAEKLKIGDPLDTTTELGPIATKAQYQKVLDYIDIGKKEGASLVAGGEIVDVHGNGQGFYVRPAVFADVKNSMRIAQEEIFGPVAAIIKFKDEEEALAIANDSDFGLAAGVWTKDFELAYRMATRLEAGTVWINNYRKAGYATPFGGYKDSGVGRENGPEALYEYSQEKSIWVDVGAGVKDPFNPRA